MTEAAVKPLEGHVEDGHYEQEGDGSHQHTAGTSHTQGDVTVSTYAMRKDKGSIPNIMVSEVIRMGRKRTRAADIAAIVMLIPWR